MATKRTLISSGSTFEAQIGYSRAVVDGDWIFVSGTTGFDYSTMTLPDDVVAQAERALRNIDSALRQADSSLADVVRCGVFLADVGDFAAMDKVYSDTFPRPLPARTTVGAAFPLPGMLVEIDCVAVLPSTG